MKNIMMNRNDTTTENENLTTDGVTEGQGENVHIEAETQKSDFNLNGEAWKAKKSETYISILDMYGVKDLFAAEKTHMYRENMERRKETDNALRDYIFTKSEKEDFDNELADILFSKEIKISNTRNYNASSNSNVFLYVLFALPAVMIFACIMVKFNIGRRKKREKYASEINMEN